MDKRPLITEEWRDIPGLPTYQASSQGRIRTMRSGHGCRNEPGHVMAGCPDEKGYLLVNCRIGSVSRTQRVHRLVARAFLGKILKGQQVNHKNGIKNDNRRENLEICSQSQNMKHRHSVLNIDIKWLGSKHGLSKLTEADIPAIRERFANGESASAIARDFPVSAAAIYAVVSRKTWSHVS